ncbi:MAG TPA: hypothetical protein VGC79_02800 [Polyangiaceae bacterium]
MPENAVDNLAVRTERRYPMNPGWRVLTWELSAEGSHFHMANASKTEMLENLRGMLRDVLRLRTEGVAYAKLSRAHGYLDGYMRVLLETGLFSQKELLALISEERNLHDGPATGIVTEEAREARPEAAPVDAPHTARSNRAHAA